MAELRAGETDYIPRRVALGEFHLKSFLMQRRGVSQSSDASADDQNPFKISHRNYLASLGP